MLPGIVTNRPDTSLIRSTLFTFPPQYLLDIRITTSHALLKAAAIMRYYPHQCANDKFAATARACSVIPADLS